MKKFILAAIGILSMLQIEAQILPFEVEVPNVKFIRSKNGVNIRQQPSVNSKKLIADEYYQRDFGDGESKWSKSLPKGFKTVKFFSGVTDIEKNDWYFIENAVDDFIDEDGGGWVSSRFCETFVPTPIEYPRTNYKSYSYYRHRPAIKWIKGTQNYKDGEYVLILEGHFGDNSDLSISLGKLVDGLIICPFAFPVVLDEDLNFLSDGDNNFYLKQKSEKNWLDSNWYIVPPKYKEKSHWADYNISDSFVNELLNKVEPLKLDNPNIYYLYNDCLYSSFYPEIKYPLDFFIEEWNKTHSNY